MKYKKNISGKTGLGYGSKYQLLRMLGWHRNFFNKEVGRIINREDINWFDFVFDGPEDKELLNARFLDSADIEKDWEDMWPTNGGKNGINWDAVGKAGDTYILVEAKAHIDECYSSGRGGGKKEPEKAEKTIREFKNRYKIEDKADWLDGRYYQLANRLVFTDFLKRKGIDVKLVYVLFLNGYEFNVPAGCVKSVYTEEEWKEKFDELFSDMGIKGTDAENLISYCYINCNEEEGRQIMGDKNVILENLKDYFNNRDILLPKGIELIKIDDQELELHLSAKKIQEKNMQIDDNAFEGWATAIYAATDLHIKLCVDGKLENHYEEQGHLCRFLYRAMKFSDQYEWFSLSQGLQGSVEEFRKFIENNTFTNNLANGEAGTKEDHNKENVVEAKLAEQGVLRRVLKENFDIGNNPVYRQLPVGLFKGDVSKKTLIFTGGKSAIDLWTWNGSEFIVIELKTLNQMVGIVSEIFFYSNYWNDFLIEEEKSNFVLNGNTTKDDRGYSNIKNNTFTKICGLMLADSYHPLVNEEIVNILNAGREKNHIEYKLASYRYELALTGN